MRVEVNVAYGVLFTSRKALNLGIIHIDGIEVSDRHSTTVKFLLDAE